MHRGSHHLSRHLSLAIVVFLILVIVVVHNQTQRAAVVPNPTAFSSPNSSSSNRVMFDLPSYLGVDSYETSAVDTRLATVRVFGDPYGKPVSQSDHKKVIASVQTAVSNGSDVLYVLNIWNGWLPQSVITDPAALTQALAPLRAIVHGDNGSTANDITAWTAAQISELNAIINERNKAQPFPQKIFVQIGNDVATPAISDMIRAAANPPLAPLDAPRKYSDPLIANAYSSLVLQPVLAGMQTRSQYVVPVLGSVYGTREPSIQQWLATLLDTVMPQLGRTVRSSIGIVTVHSEFEQGYSNAAAWLQQVQSIARMPVWIVDAGGYQFFQGGNGPVFMMHSMFSLLNSIIDHASNRGNIRFFVQRITTPPVGSPDLSASKSLSWLSTLLTRRTVTRLTFTADALPTGVPWLVHSYRVNDRYLVLLRAADDGPSHKLNSVTIYTPLRGRLILREIKSYLFNRSGVTSTVQSLPPMPITDGVISISLPQPVDVNDGGMLFELIQ